MLIRPSASRNQKTGKAIEDGQPSGFVSAGDLARRAHLQACKKTGTPRRKIERAVILEMLPIRFFS
jgi:hypothetical protein